MKRTILALLTVALCTLGTANAWADSTVTVRSNTVDVSAGENGSEGWWFNRDAANDTPYAFTADEASIGSGSLFVQPISPNPADKFIAENFARQPIDELTSIAFDFLISGTGATTDGDDFYINVYANTIDDNKFYDCRYNYVAADPANLTDFATATFAATDTPTSVTRSGTARIATCPATLAEMDGYVRMFSINVGQTSASDLGLAGYLDNVVVTTTTDGATTYDFEPAPASKDDCKAAGHLNLGFANQGECVAFAQANPNAM